MAGTFDPSRFNDDDRERIVAFLMEMIALESVLYEFIVAYYAHPARTDEFRKKVVKTNATLGTLAGMVTHVLRENGDGKAADDLEQLVPLRNSVAHGHPAQTIAIKVGQDADTEQLEVVELVDMHTYTGLTKEHIVDTPSLKVFEDVSVELRATLHNLQARLA